MHGRQPPATASRFGIAATVLILLAGCTVAVDEGPSRPRPHPERPAMCTFEHDPVCGRRGEQQRTFANACLARSAGYRIISHGECRRERPRKPVACTAIYRPVCGIRRGQTRTFSNACVAEAENYRIIGDGPC